VLHGAKGRDVERGNAAAQRRDDLAAFDSQCTEDVREPAGLRPQILICERTTLAASPEPLERRASGERTRRMAIDGLMRDVEAGAVR
jgi:hypothetical protein